MGANAFNIRFKESRVRFGGGGRNGDMQAKKRGLKEKKSNLGKPIRKEEAEFFKANYTFPGSQVSIYRRGPGAQEIHFEEKINHAFIRLERRSQWIPKTVVGRIMNGGC